MFYLIVNPSSRSGNKGNTEEKMKAILQERGVACHALHTKYAGHARAMAAEISDAAAKEGTVHTIAVLGGDGTVNEVINGITDFDAVRFAALPVGSGNDCARGLGLLEEPEETVLRRAAEEKVLRQLDICEAVLDTEDGKKTHRFVVSGGIGFDAAVVEETNRSRVKPVLNKVHLGSLSYSAIAVKQIVTAKECVCDLETDAAHMHFDRILLASAMNVSYQGGGFCFAPDAQPDDGKLNGIVIGDIPLLRELMAFPKIKTGNHYGIKGVTHFQAEKIDIRTSVPLFVHTDGEILGKTDHVVFSCTGRKIGLIV